MVMVNTELLKVATSQILESMGFAKEDDGSGDPRGVDWNIRTDKFHLYVDPWCEVSVARRNPDTEYITLHVPNLNTLRAVVNWVTQND